LAVDGIERVQFFFKWMLASVPGVVIGAVSLLVFIEIDFGYALVAAGVSGGVLGALQWLVLRREVSWAGWWVLGNIAVWAAALAALGGDVWLSGWLFEGFATGIALSLLLD